MNKEAILNLAEDLVEKCEVTFLGMTNGEGFPYIDALLKLENEGVFTFWLSTNSASNKVKLIRNEPKTCLYFADLKRRKGLTLLGEANLLMDTESRKKVWRNGFEKYYPDGISDSDHTVIKFTTKTGYYYYKGNKISFEV